MDNRIKMELGNWIKDYSINNYGEDWKVCVSLGYKFGVKNDKVCRKWIGRLKNYLNKNNIIVDGFVVNEYDKNIINLHNHLLLYGNDNWSNIKSKIFNYWNKIGSVDVMKYDSSLDFNNYILKYIGRNNNNDWDLISNY